MSKKIFSPPTLKESIVFLSLMASIMVLTAVFVGLRPEHGLLLGLYTFLFFFNVQTRKLAVALAPFLIFGLSYDWMRVFPKYMVNPVDIEGLYNLEKQIFGININGETLIPCEYFARHNSPVLDFLAGLFYITWVPIPVGFGLYLFFTGSRKIYLHFAMVFLFVNLLGFAIYYIHPAAPPWYAMNFGFDLVLDTPGNMAGLARFDELVGMPLFDSIYGRNANVFAAVPSLHSAYLLIALYYAVQKKCNWIIITVIAVFLVGIWFTAVYTSHHYIIDVILGILCAMVGIFIFEKILLKTTWFSKFFQKYYNYIA